MSLRVFLVKNITIIDSIAEIKSNILIKLYIDLTHKQYFLYLT